jgi:hypothetical protein
MCCLQALLAAGETHEVLCLVCESPAHMLVCARVCTRIHYMIDWPSTVASLTLVFMFSSDLKAGHNLIGCMTGLSSPSLWICHQCTHRMLILRYTCDLLLKHCHCVHT